MTCESWLKPSLILNLTAGDEPEDEPGIENLRGYGDLVDWGRRVGLLAEDEVGRLLDEAARSLEEVGSVHARALELRGGILRGLLGRSGARTAAVRGYGAPAPGRGRGYLTREAPHAGGSCPARSDSTGSGQQSQPLETLRAVAHAAIGLLRSRDLNRVKRCSSCCWLFVDASRNRSRR